MILKHPAIEYATKERRTHTGQHKTVDNTQTQEGIQRANTASSENAGRHATYDNHEGASINSTFKHSEGWGWHAEVQAYKHTRRVKDAGEHTIDEQSKNAIFFFNVQKHLMNKEKSKINQRQKRSQHQEGGYVPN